MEEKKKSSFGAYKNLILFAVMMIAAVIVVAVKPSGKSYTGEAQGIESTVSVTIKVDDAGTITTAIVDVSGETQGLGADIGDTMVAAILEAQSDEIDVVSGCTVTSDAVRKALQDAMTQAGMEIHENVPEAAPTGSSGEGATDDVLHAGSYTAGTYTATARGMEEVTVTVTLDESGTITDLEIDASKETPELGQVAAPKLQERILEAGTIEGIDAITGCTLTSNAIFNAVTDCYGQAAQ